MALPHRTRRITLAVAATAALVGGLLGGLRVASAATGDGSPSDPNVTFVGRWDTADPTAYAAKWAGAYAKVGFTGRTVQLKQRGVIDLFASIDGGPDVPFTKVKGTVNLTPTPLAAGDHTLRVSYRPVAGSYHGDAVYQGLVLDAGEHTYRAPVSPQLIEFIGDSITVGQLTARQAPDAYGWLVGDRLGAEHTQIAQGGACLVATADGCVGLSVQFLKTGAEATSPDWDFSRYQATAVVINLGTNDVGHSVHTPEFESTYVTLLERVRAKYPNAVIFALETFRKRFVTQTQNAVTARNNAGDQDVYFVNTEGWIDEATDTVDNVHPNETGHLKIADRLAPIIAARLGATPTPTATTPPVTTSPVTEPPTTSPVTEPPTTEPPTTSPVTEPPVTEPPVTEPPVTEPPVTEPPVTEPPVTEPPVTEPPVTEPPVTEPPSPTPPTTTPPATTSPTTAVPSATTPTATSSAACAVTYTVQNRWPGGFQVDVTVRNTGSATLDGWSLRWTFAGGEQVSQMWNATVSQTGSAVTATAASWNAALAAGGSTSFGFLGTGDPAAESAGFTLNGTTCTVA